MILVDTSIWIDIFRDRQGTLAQTFRDRIRDTIYGLTRFTQLELLQGSNNEGEWKKLHRYLSTQFYLEASQDTWVEAARIYFELRRIGRTGNSPIDCCIASVRPVTVLKVAHHGANTSNSSALLQKTQPRLALISAGRRNRFGHPSVETLERLEEARVTTLATPDWGTIRIETDGLEWKVFHYSIQEGEFREFPVGELTPAAGL